MMVRSDYILIASCVRDARRRLARHSEEALAEYDFHVKHELARALFADNPNFDATRFLSACEIPPSI